MARTLITGGAGFVGEKAGFVGEKAGLFGAKVGLSGKTGIFGKKPDLSGGGSIALNRASNSQSWLYIVKVVRIVHRLCSALTSGFPASAWIRLHLVDGRRGCLLYTSDAADE